MDTLTYLIILSYLLVECTTLLLYSFLLFFLSLYFSLTFLSSSAIHSDSTHSFTVSFILLCLHHPSLLSQQCATVSFWLHYYSYNSSPSLYSHDTKWLLDSAYIWEESQGVWVTSGGVNKSTPSLVSKIDADWVKLGIFPLLCSHFVLCVSLHAKCKAWLKRWSSMWY